MVYIISADEIKKSLPGYTPAQSEKVHRESAKLADKAFEGAMKTRSEATVVIMAGGSASGKTEYVSGYLSKQKVIVFDGTLPSFEGAQIKIRRALKASKKVEIHLIVPESLSAAFTAFLNRERKFAALHFYRTHSGSRATVLRIAQEYQEIPIKVLVSQVVQSPASYMDFSEISFGTHQALIEYLQDNQYNQATIEEKTLDKG